MNDKELWEREISCWWATSGHRPEGIEHSLRSYKEEGKWHEVGDYYFERNEFSTAKDYYEKSAQKEDIHSWRSRCNIAQCIYRQGNVSGSIDHLLRLNVLWEESIIREPNVHKSYRDSFFNQSYFTRVALKIAIKHGLKNQVLSILEKYLGHLSMNRFSDDFKVFLNCFDILGACPRIQFSKA